MTQPVVHNEIDLLYAASNKLAQASTSLEQLEAVSDYARNRGATRGALFYLEFEDDYRIDEVVAEWVVGNEKPLGVGTLFQLPRFDESGTLVSHPLEPNFFENTAEDELVRPLIRDIHLKHNIQASVVLPLYNKGRWVAGILFGWNVPQQFNEDDARIYTLIQQQAAPVVDSIRLFEQTQRRATELEAANQEINLLYRTSEIINGANTYEEVVEAVAQFDPDADVVTLMLWENLDWETATYLDVVTVLDRTSTNLLQAGQRLAKDDFPIAQVMYGERVWIFEDALNDPRVDPLTAKSWELLNIRSFTGPALYVNKHYIGGITFHSSKPRQYSKREVRLFTGVGDLVIAAIQRIRSRQEMEAARQHAETLARTNAELLEQTQRRAAELEAAKAEIDLLYRVGEAINAANSYDELVKAVSGIITDATSLLLAIWEGWDFETATYLEPIAATGCMEPLTGHRFPKDAMSLSAHAYGNRMVVSEDIAVDMRHDTIMLETLLAHDLRAYISILLYVGDRWIGVLSICSTTPRHFSEHDKHLASGVGDYVLGAVERIRLREETEAARQRAEALVNTNALLLEQTQRRAAELEAAKAEIDLLYRVGESINAANSFEELVNALSGIIGGVTAVTLFFWEGWDFQTATYVEQVAATGYMAARTGQRVPKETLPYVHNFADDRLMIFEDVATDSRLDHTTIAKFQEQHLLAALSIRLYVKNRWIGALVFHSSTPQLFSEREQRLAVGIGDYVLGAVERIRLREETEAARQRAEALSAQTQQLAVLEERNRIARELHDSVSQALYGIALGARTSRTYLDTDPQRSIEPLDYVLALSEAGLAEMRALIFELRPETLEKEGLLEALSKQVAMLRARHGLDVRTAFGLEPDIPLPLKEAVYWIAREALHNIVKHANATIVDLSLTCMPGSIELLIEDDGIGFDSSADFSGHLGLKSMTERAIKIGGALEIQSHWQQGTRIQLSLSLTQSE